MRREKGGDLFLLCDADGDHLVSIMYIVLNMLILCVDHVEYLMMIMLILYVDHVEYEC